MVLDVEGDVSKETRRNETRVAEATRRKEASDAERVRAELAVQRARDDRDHG